jgi:hypothetical protein
MTKYEGTVLTLMRVAGNTGRRAMRQTTEDDDIGSCMAMIEGVAAVKAVTWTATVCRDALRRCRLPLKQAEATGGTARPLCRRGRVGSGDIDGEESPVLSPAMRGRWRPTIGRDGKLSSSVDGVDGAFDKVLLGCS